MATGAQYRFVRGMDGYRRTDAEYYRRLPWTTGEDPQASEWNIRQRSYALLLRRVLAVDARGRRILDVGAGAGWLSHRLAVLGHRPVAIDRSADGEDGLGACRHYEVNVPCVQADFHALPFAPGTFDLVVFNASLHYADNIDVAMAEALRVARPGAPIAVLDSPMFADPDHGEQMVRDRLAHFRQQGVADPVRMGVGYLTFDGLGRTARTIGRTATFVPTRGPWLWELRRLLARHGIG